jgi:hypothetical protein
VENEAVPPRLVIDTNVFVSGLISEAGSPALLLRALRDRRARDKAIGGHQNETDALTFKTPEDQAKFLAESSRKHTIPGDVSENGFGPGVRLPGGLHAEQGRVDPSTGQFLVTSHIDRFNPNNGLGPMVGHAVVDVFIGTIFFHHTAGLDQ